MSNFNDNISVGKPIHRIEDILMDLDKKLNTMKVDVAVIQSDLKIILKRIEEKQKQEDEILMNQVQKQENLSRGWFFTY
tara:strand:- start:486 stop:722 length:237 start_codon:yes stop_codon:yes gene_type:complete